MSNSSSSTPTASNPDPTRTQLPLLDRLRNTADVERVNTLVAILTTDNLGIAFLNEIGTVDNLFRTYRSSIETLQNLVDDHEEEILSERAASASTRESLNTSIHSINNDNSTLRSQVAELQAQLSNQTTSILNAPTLTEHRQSSHENTKWVEPDPFTGEDATLFEKWLLDMQDKIDFSPGQFPDKRREVAYYRKKLEGKAYDQIKYGFARGKTPLFTEPQQMIDILLIAYGNNIDIEITKEKWLGLRQKDGQDLLTYLAEWNQNSRVVDFGEGEKQQLLHHSLNKQYKKRVENWRLDHDFKLPSNMADFQHLLRQLAQNQRIQSQLFGTTNHGNSNNNNAGNQSNIPARQAASQDNRPRFDPEAMDLSAQSWGQPPRQTGPAYYNPPQQAQPNASRVRPPAPTVNRHGVTIATSPPFPSHTTSINNERPKLTEATREYRRFYDLCGICGQAHERSTCPVLRITNNFGQGALYQAPPVGVSAPNSALGIQRAEQGNA